MYDPINKTLSKEGGLSIDEVRQCLSSSSRDLATLCMHTNVNLWAKYKPVNRPFVYGETGKSSGNDYWKAQDGKCGFAFTIKSGGLGSLSIGLVKDLFDGLMQWSRATLNAPYRLLDFDGYIHDAVCPITEPEEIVMKVYNGRLGIGYYYDTELSADNLKLTDINYGALDFRTWYFSVAVYAIGANGQPTSVRAKSSDLQLKDEEANFFVEFDDFVATDTEKPYIIIPFLAESQVDEEVGRDFQAIGLPLWKKSVNIVNYVANLRVQISYATTEDGGKNITISASAINSGATAHTFTGFKALVSSGSAVQEISIPGSLTVQPGRQEWINEDIHISNTPQPGLRVAIRADGVEASRFVDVDYEDLEPSE